MSESSPPSSSIASLSYSLFANRSHSLNKEDSSQLAKSLLFLSLSLVYLRVVWELCELVLDCEQVTRLVRNELVKVHQTVEEDADLAHVLSELCQLEMAFCRLWLDHVIHLAKEVHKENGFMIKVLEPMDLLFIEVIHLMRCDNLVVIEVNYFEPVLQRAKRSLVLLGQHEPDEVFVPHLVFLAGFELARNLVKDAVDRFA